MVNTVYPDFDYSDNINGGNPDKPLILGELEFEGDPELIKQEGVIGTLKFYREAIGLHLVLAGIYKPTFLQLTLIPQNIKMDFLMLI